MWPKNFNSAVALTFDLDIETPWIADNPDVISRPSVLSMARYVPRVAVPLILSMLERLDVKGTFFIPGKSAEDFPESVKAIVAGGHEIGAHGYTHDPPLSLSPQEEEAQLKRTYKVLSEFGVNVVGYRAPLYEVSEHTMGLLKKHSFRYSSNLMDDIKPYKHADIDIIELPVHWIMDDWVQFAHDTDDSLTQNATCAHVFQLWMEEFQAINELGGLFVLTMHPQVIGRPSRVKMLADLIAEFKTREDVWITTCSKVAAHLDSVLS
jgi:peptidoglycan/xylan/chitin deacetylase (PgdA/CDA1 family)